MDKDLLISLQDEAKWIRQRIVNIAYKAGKKGAHLGGSLSVVEILSALYAQMNLSSGVDRDRMILSKGHSALALYCLLEHQGVLTREETETFETNGTHFYAHAPRNIEKGVEFSGGSLSLGASFGVGVALACQKKGLTNRIYIILGDGECDEGLVWESAMSIANYSLKNVTIIVDCNGVQLDGTTNDVMNTNSLADKFRAFGFDTVEVDGHNLEVLYNVFTAQISEKPKAVIAQTVKGKGLSFCEGLYIWHHNILTDTLYKQALDELK
ncbi:MAG: transketolase [Tannerellaceae bacterium]